MQKKLFIIVCIFAVLGVTGTVYYRNKYVSLSATIEAANGSELIRQLESVTTELERTRTALAESQQSVERLTQVDQRRATGIGRIYRIIDEAERSVSGIASGEQRARIAFEAIAGIVDELEAEFGRGPK